MSHVNNFDSRCGGGYITQVPELKKFDLEMEYELSQVNQNSFKDISDTADKILFTKPFMPVIMLPGKSKILNILLYFFYPAIYKLSLISCTFQNPVVAQEICVLLIKDSQLIETKHLGLLPFPSISFIIIKFWPSEPLCHLLNS